MPCQEDHTPESEDKILKKVDVSSFSLDHILLVAFFRFVDMTRLSCESSSLTEHKYRHLWSRKKWELTSSSSEHHHHSCSPTRASSVSVSVTAIITKSITSSIFKLWASTIKSLEVLPVWGRCYWFDWLSLSVSRLISDTDPSCPSLIPSVSCWLLLIHETLNHSWKDCLWHSKELFVFNCLSHYR